MMTVTHGSPKELLPIGSTTVIDWVANEASELGGEVILVWREDKGHLGRPWKTRFQIAKEGLAPAICSAFERGEPSGRAVVLLPDTIFYPFSPTKDLLSKLEAADFVLAVETISDDQVNRYGIVELDENQNITRVIEKPKATDTDSRLAVSARYAFSEKFVNLMRKAVEQHPLGPKELGITEILNAALDANLAGKIVPLSEGTHRLDCGSPQGYAEALAMVNNR